MIVTQRYAVDNGGTELQLVHYSFPWFQMHVSLRVLSCVQQYKTSHTCYIFVSWCIPNGSGSHLLMLRSAIVFSGIYMSGA